MFRPLVLAFVSLSGDLNERRSYNGDLKLRLANNRVQRDVTTKEEAVCFRMECGGRF